MNPGKKMVRMCWRVLRVKFALTVTTLGCVGLLFYREFLPEETSNNVDFLRVKRLLIHHHRILFKEFGGRRHVFKKSPQNVYAERRARVQEVCADMDYARDSRFMERFVNESWFVQDLHLLYCSVPKTGCTFWKRVLQVLRRRRRRPQLRSPYKLMYEECPAGRVEARAQIEFDVVGGSDLYDVVTKRYTKFMFARDPWERLFSVYVDKVFSPNGKLWSLAAEAMVDVKRHVTFGSNRHPGHNASFAEFIHYVVTEGEGIDPHMRPVHRVCGVCNVDFDVIGKMETFQEDLHHILTTVNATEMFVFKNLPVESTIDKIAETVGRVFQYRGEVERFLPFHDILRRVWDRFKIENVLDKDERFPLSEKDSGRIEMEEFANILITLYRNSSLVPRFNKKVAFIQAYRQLTNVTLEAIRKIFRLDFLLFEYDISGPHLSQFETGIPKSELDHDYFDILRSL